MASEDRCHEQESCARVRMARRERPALRLVRAFIVVLTGGLAAGAFAVLLGLAIWMGATSAQAARAMPQTLEGTDQAQQPGRVEDYDPQTSHLIIAPDYDPETQWFVFQLNPSEQLDSGRTRIVAAKIDPETKTVTARAIDVPLDPPIHSPALLHGGDTLFFTRYEKSGLGHYASYIQPAHVVAYGLITGVSEIIHTHFSSVGVRAAVRCGDHDIIVMREGSRKASGSARQERGRVKNGIERGAYAVLLKIDRRTGETRRWDIENQSMSSHFFDFGCAGFVAEVTHELPTWSAEKFIRDIETNLPRKYVAVSYQHDLTGDGGEVEAEAFDTPLEAFSRIKPDLPAGAGRAACDYRVEVMRRMGETPYAPNRYAPQGSNLPYRTGQANMLKDDIEAQHPDIFTYYGRGRKEHLSFAFDGCKREIFVTHGYTSKLKDLKFHRLTYQDHSFRRVGEFLMTIVP